MRIFDSSHLINHLSFPDVIQPLDRTQKDAPRGLARYQYFIQIVPTVYKYLNGKQVYSNQYSVSESDYIIESTTGSFKQPGNFKFKSFSKEWLGIFLNMNFLLTVSL